MYSYRSQIAHGGIPKFTEDLKLLQSAEVALTLIRETVKNVVRHALIEPQLVLDLRDC